MTATTMPTTTARATTPGSRTTPSAVTFPRVLAAEWIKLRSLRSTVWTLSVTVLVMAGISFLIALSTAAMDDPSLLGAGASAAPLVTNAGYFGQLALVVLGVLVITGEYSTGMIRSTFAAVPRRLPALWAKVVVTFVVAAVTSAVAVALSAVVALPFLDGLGATLDLSDPTTLRILGGTVLYLATIAVFALAIGAVLRHSAGALATALGLLLVIETVFAAIPHAFFRNVSPFLPGTAGSQLLMADPTAAAMPAAGPVLTPWQGYGVLVAWVVVLLVAAAVLMRRRDA